MVANRTVAATRLPLALPLARVSLGLAMAAAVLTPEPPVQLAVAAYERLKADGISTRVVSMPCLEWFDEQGDAYRDSVLLPSVRARVAIEAGSTLGWWKYVGDRGRIIGIDHFGASADQQTLFENFGITVDAVVAAAIQSIRL